MSTKTIYKATMNKSLKGYFPSGMTQLASVTGGQVNQNFKTKYNTNLIRLFFQAIAVGAGAAGTSTILDFLVTRVRIWKGTNDGGKPIVDLDNTSLSRAYRMSVMRLAPGAQSASMPMITNPAVAAAGTYNAWVDLAINLIPGDYYVQVDFAPVAAMAVYVPTGLTFGFTLAAIDLGFDIVTPEGWKSGAKTVTNGFSIAGTREVYVEALAAGLAGIVSVFDFDGQQLNNFGIQSASSFVTDKIAALPTAASAIYMTADNTTSLRVELGTATTTFFVSINY